MSGIERSDRDLLRDVARARPAAPSTSATPEEVDAVITLQEVGREVAEHGRAVLQGERADWAGLSERLAAAAGLCRRLVVVDAAGRVVVREGIGDDGAPVWFVTLVDADGTAREDLHVCREWGEADRLASVERGHRGE